MLPIQSACQSQKLIKEVMEFLKSQGISTTYAVKIYKQYGDKSIVKFQHRRGLLTFFSCNYFILPC